MVLQRLKKPERTENSNSTKTEKLKELCARQPAPTRSPATTAEAAEANKGGQRLTCNAVNAMLEGVERETLASITLRAAFRASVKKNYRCHCCCKFSNPTCNFADSTVELPRESTGLVQMATDTRGIH